MVPDTIKKIFNKEDFKMIPGRGVAAKVEGYHALAGNRAMLNENNITFPQQMTIFGQPFHWLCCIV